MTKEEFVNTINIVIEKVQALFGVRGKALTLVESANGDKKYKRRICFKDTSYDLTYEPDRNEEMLLSGFIDVFADLINEAHDFVKTPDGYIPLGGLLVFPKKTSESSDRWAMELAENLYNRTASLVYDRFQIGLKINLRLMEELSTRTYEGDISTGNIVFCTNSLVSQADLVPEFHSGIFWNREFLGQIRKLLAGVREDNALLFIQKEDGEYRFEGYCADFHTLEQKYIRCRIRCEGPSAWTLFYGSEGKKIFRMIHSRPQICEDHHAYAMRKLEETFPSYFQEKQRLNANALLDMAGEQKHGTALVFVDFKCKTALMWIKRLCALCRAVEVHESQPNTFCAKESKKFNITRMDGALLIDAETMCIRYITAILDGRAILPGQLDKGARHNSIQTFLGDLCCENVKTPGTSLPPLCAVIFSSDGDMEVLTSGEIVAKLSKRKTKNGINEAG